MSKMKTRSTVAKHAVPDVVAVVPSALVVVPQKRTNAYKQQSLLLLKNDFPIISVDAIRRAFDFSGHSVGVSYRILSTINDCVNVEDEEERRKNILKLTPFLKDTKRIVLKKNRKMDRPCRPTEPSLLKELAMIPEMNTKENRPMETKEQDVDDDDTKQASEPVFVCNCCFEDEVPFESMCQCNEGHLVCKDCLRHHVNEQLDGKGVGHFSCMDMEAVPKCTATYSSTQLDRAFSPKSRQKVDEKIFRFAFEKADMDDGRQCPKCNHLFFANILPNDAVDIGCPECKHVFCRLCREAPHKSKTCEEAEAEKENLDAFKDASEAMTEAATRSCPKCNKRFFKEEGCNQMACPCGTVSCYLCRKRIKNDHQHFCRIPHCQHDACGNCVLFTNSKEDDRRARREVAEAEMKKAGAAAALIGGLLSPPRKSKKRKKAAPRRPLEPVQQDNDRQQAPNIARPAARMPPRNVEPPAPEPVPQPYDNGQQQHDDHPRVQDAGPQNANRHGRPEQGNQNALEAREPAPQPNVDPFQAEENEQEVHAEHGLLRCVIS